MHHPDFRFQLRQRCQHAVQAHNYASQPPTIVLVFRATQGRARATGRCSLSWWQVLGCKQAASFKILQLQQYTNGVPGGRTGANFHQEFLAAYRQKFLLSRRNELSRRYVANQSCQFDDFVLQ